MRKSLERQAAEAAGELYYQGADCKRNHGGRRYVSSSACAECSKLSLRKPHAPRAAIVQASQQARQDAIAAGSARFQGEPCAKGHDGLRNTSDGKCCACRKDKSKTAYHAVAGKQRACRLHRQYGITDDDFNTLLVSQKGLCAICGKPPNGRWKNLHVDHCHSTGAVRGLLCNSCNVGIGQLQDDPAILQAAIEYLQKHAANQTRQDHGGASQTS